MKDNLLKVIWLPIAIIVLLLTVLSLADTAHADFNPLGEIYTGDWGEDQPKADELIGALDDIHRLFTEYLAELEIARANDNQIEIERLKGLAVRLLEVFDAIEEEILYFVKNHRGI